LIGAIKLRARILAIVNIRTRVNVVAFNKIACNEQEKLPRVVRALEGGLNTGMDEVRYFLSA
jgi:hypothetical protein